MPGVDRYGDLPPNEERLVNFFNSEFEITKKRTWFWGHRFIFKPKEDDNVSNLQKAEAFRDAVNELIEKRNDTLPRGKRIKPAKIKRGRVHFDHAIIGLMKRTEKEDDLHQLYSNYGIILHKSLQGLSP